MHSKIFQITETRVSKDNYLNEDTLTQGDDSFFEGAVSIVVLDAGRPLYLCMRKSNRRGGNGGEIRERMG